MNRRGNFSCLGPCKNLRCCRARAPFSMRREREGMTRNVFALHEPKWRRLEAIGADRRNSCCGMVADTVDN